MIEAWIAGSHELVVPRYGYRIFVGCIIEESACVHRDYKTIDKRAEDMKEDVSSYHALILALERIKTLGLDKKKILLKSSSSALVRQMTKQTRVKPERLKRLFCKAKILANGIEIVFKKVPKRKNEAHKYVFDRRESLKYTQL